MTDTALEELEEEASFPTSIASSGGSLLSMGGLLLVVGTIGFSTVQMSAYEQRIAELESASVFGPESAMATDPLDGTDAAQVDSAPGSPAPTAAAAPPSETAIPAGVPAPDDFQQARDRIAALEGDNAKLAQALQNAEKRLAALPAEGSGQCVDQLRSRDARIAALTSENRRLNETCQASKL